MTRDAEEVTEATPNEQVVTDMDTCVQVKAGEDSTDHGVESNERGSPPNQEQLPPHSAMTTPINTPPQKLLPSSPPTSTGSGSPAGSIAGSMRGRRMSKAVAGKIQKEFETREKKLRHDLEEVKSKSRKAVTSLKAQLAESHNRHASEMEAVQNQLREVEEKLSVVQSENATLVEQMEEVRQENEELSLSLREKVGEVNRLRTFEDEGLEGQRSHVGDTMLMRQDHDEFALRRSPQWSEHSGQLTPRSVGVAPTLPMDEVM